MYEIIKTLHILFVMGWLACVFVLPRVMIHWSKETTEAISFNGFKNLAVGLFRFGSLMAILGIVCGLSLWYTYGYGGNWLLYKIAVVILLIIYHIISGLYLLRMIKKGLFKSTIFLRIFNESSLLLVVPIIYLAVSKAVSW